MGLREQQNLLARLYTDSDYRNVFFSQPESFAVDSGLNEAEIAEISTIFPEELRFFSESLIWKRCREAEKMLPLLQRVLGSEFRTVFSDYADTYNPQTIRKHLEDSIEFCNFVQAKEFSRLVKDAAKFEAARLSFFGYRKPLSFCVLRHDFRGFDRSMTEYDVPQLRKGLSITLWFRFGERVLHFTL
ncbi:MAG: hypothetical protein ACT4O9_15445 [Blastocatellia bacterium]